LRGLTSENKTKMYYQLHLSQFTTNPEALGEQLTEGGSLAITFENAGEDSETERIYEPTPGTTPLWNQVKIIALFTDKTVLKKALNLAQKENLSLQYHIEDLPDQAWERTWMNEFHPLKIGNNTWICPSWCDHPDPKAINILLDPGLAFGTGTHPTTALCLEWIDGDNFQNKTVIDYGCGSGILAIAALLHGADSVAAIDYDPQALEATKDNAQRNRIDLNKLQILKPEALAENYKVDIILANILAEPLIQLAPLFAKHLNPQGKIALSGILQDQTDSIIQAYTPFFKDFKIKEQDGWVRIDAVI
jgi:ribosomal protein L11 methyltransferase